MDAIECLEREISEKRAELKRLKEERDQGRRLNFKRIRVGSSDALITPLRNFVLQLSTTSKCKNKDGSVYMRVDYHQVKVRDVSEEKIRICNDFLGEIYPIVAKYMEIFSEMEESNA